MKVFANKAKYFVCVADSIANVLSPYEIIAESDDTISLLSTTSSV